LMPQRHDQDQVIYNEGWIDWLQGQNHWVWSRLKIMYTMFWKWEQLIFFLYLQ